MVRAHPKPSYCFIAHYCEIMAKKGKGARVVVALVCSETGDTNYHTMINKTVTPKLELMKYSPRLRKRTKHVSKDKLK